VSAARTREAARNAPRFAWLAFILLPLVASLGGRHSAAHTALTVAGTSLFVGLYAVVVISARRRRMLPGGGALVIVSLAALYGLAATLTLVDGGGWGFLFTYAVAVAAMALPAAIASGAVVGSTALAAAVTAASGAPSGTVLGYAASTAGVGLLMRRLADLRVRNCELSSARAELARLAVAEERQRFARDLHDLLGHSLSVIALKAELAGRLLPERSDEAAREVAELEQVARAALVEVREAVSGYREPTLASELAGARMALAAAGIAVRVDGEDVPLSSGTEAVLAWAVREGATNVIRHSRARTCRIRIAADDHGAELEIIDDGVGPGSGDEAVPPTSAASAPAAPAGARRRDPSGHGLHGLAERARARGGWVEAGEIPGGGYRLAVRLPVSDPPGADPAGGSAPPVPAAQAVAPVASPPPAAS